MRNDYRWNEWNIDHIAEHGVTPEEAEYIVDHARPPFPQRHGGGKFLAVGRLPDGTYLQVIFIESPKDVLYVVHSRELTHAEKRKFRRRTK